jgi:hypothetical protein
MDLSEREKLDHIANFWFGVDGSTTWPLPGARVYNPGAPSNIVEQARREENISTLDELRGLTYPLMDGLVLPSIRTREARDILIEELEKNLNEVAGYGSERRIVMSEEVKSFLLYADGVENPNFHRDWICGWDIEIGREEETVKDEKKREQVLTAYVIGADELSEQTCLVASHLDFKVAIHGGESNDGKCMWNSYLMFCRRCPDQDEEAVYGDDSSDVVDESSGWGWKVVFDTSSYHDDHLTPPLIFDDIPSFLEWYGNWEELLDLDQMRENLQTVLDNEGNSYPAY